MRRVLAGLIALALAGGLSGCWWQPGFTAGRTDSNGLETRLTSQNVGDLVRLWDLPIVGSHSPVSVGGTIYVSAGKSVIAIRSNTGSTRWTHTGATDVVHFGSLVYHDGVIVAQYAAPNPGSLEPNGGLRRIDPRTGAVLGDEMGSFPGLFASGPAVPDGLLAVPDIDGTAFDATASVTWRFRPVLRFALGGQPPGPFAIVGDRIVWSQGHTLMGFSAACPPAPEPFPPGSCAPDWSSDVGSISDVAAVGADKVAVAGTSRVQILDVATGAVVCSADVGGTIRGLAVTSSSLLVTTADATTTGRLVSLRADDCGGPGGEPEWQAPLTTTNPSGLAASMSTPVVGGEVVYVGLHDEVVAFDLGGCDQAECDAITSVGLDRGEDVRGLIVDNGRVFVTTDNGLVALGLGG